MAKYASACALLIDSTSDGHPTTGCEYGEDSQNMALRASSNLPVGVDSVRNLRSSRTTSRSE